ncbi:nitrogen fixation protein NifZ [Anabaena minutissima FACHB-250]|jgi:nitrogen fixation protein NifZ|uniref:nitrogen fixation protein NifZ n=1 Tax=Nostoc sp. UHCC 0870 TaxID=2914041 RepID=UPI00168642E1|nr:nitrogen fixation protein NifZ [Nostoc sp. UHCC 0870]MBD2360839.1 nitrogen fixation protein NifZ [Anabaena minutissima FACHB-250]UKO97360.1 nitrogen fixation protein NifZ [Nostoc sp. UHCC 0870]
MQRDEYELDLEPAFELGEKVRLRKQIKNDGTFPGRELGEILAKKGDIGYVSSIGTFLQRSYIYAIHFLDKGIIVGCREREIESAEENHESDVTNG